MKEYTFFDKEGNEWTGVRPEFMDQIKNLISKDFNSRIHVSA